jgi:hypothetical protein
VKTNKARGSKRLQSGFVNRSTYKIAYAISSWLKYSATHMHSHTAVWALLCRCHVTSMPQWWLSCPATLTCAIVVQCQLYVQWSHVCSANHTHTAYIAKRAQTLEYVILRKQIRHSHKHNDHLDCPNLSPIPTLCVCVSHSKRHYLGRQIACSLKYTGVPRLHSLHTIRTDLCSIGVLCGLESG